jgi:putative endoribonuclease L-PSP
MKIINTQKAPAAIGPYVQGVIHGNTVFVSGQLGIDMSTNELAENVEKQARCSLKNMSEILKEAGTDKSKVLKTTIFLKNMSDFAVVNEVYAEFFEGKNPARSCIEVAALPKGGLVEIECIAAIE